MNPKMAPSEENVESAAAPTVGQHRTHALSRWMPTTLTAVFALATAYYLFLAWRGVSQWWFSPRWTTDDALQQVYPFFAAIKPEIFANDLVTTMMRCYLAPIHFWMGYGITLLTKSPIMTAHWMMLIQVVLALSFMFLAVRRAAGTVPALFAVAWLTHTRHVMQRLTAGLPRGWAAVMFTAYFWLVLTKRYNALLALFAIGCLLHPPATLVIGLAHGLFLTLCVANRESRGEYLPHFKRLLMAAPVYALLMFSVLKMPPEIGSMVSFDQASQMPQFQSGGRFPFLPFQEPWREIRFFGFQAFIGKLYRPSAVVSAWMPTVVMGLLGALVAVGYLRRRKVIPTELWCFLVASLSVYAASRVFAFKLYVPNRHLQFPLAIFCIIAFSIAAWRAFHRDDLSTTRILTSELKRAWLSAVALVVIGCVVFVGSRTGLEGPANFNYPTHKRGAVFKWIRENTPELALVAGEPTLIDPVQLFGERKGYITTETAHPFYLDYLTEIERRLDITLRAHFATNAEEFLTLLRAERIDYFVFDRTKFTPDGLKKSTYFAPFGDLMKSLTAHPPERYLLRVLEADADAIAAGVLPFTDKKVALVDVEKLRVYVESKKSTTPL